MFLHTRIKVRDIEKSIAFYSTHFGMVCRTRKESGRGTQLAFMTMPGTLTELELAYLPWDPDFTLDEDIFHMAFKVDDMHQTIEKLKADGVKITEEISERREGGYMAFIDDPSGYEIELLSFTEEHYKNWKTAVQSVEVVTH